MKYFYALFFLSGFIDNNNQLQICNHTNPHICCKNNHNYKVIMTCENNKECDYLNITYLDNTKTKHTIYLDVKKSTIKGGLFDAELENATSLYLHKNLIIFMSTINKLHNYIRYNIYENLCIKKTIL